MTLYQEIEKKLEEHLSFRERRFRGKGLAILALRSLNLEEKWRDKRPLELQDLVDFAGKYDSYDRIWRMVLQEKPELRGKDYEPDKDIYEQEKILGLGYEVGFRNDIKLKVN